VAQQPHLLLGVVLREALLGELVGDAEMPRQALDVARRDLDLGIAAAVQGTAWSCSLSEAMDKRRIVRACNLLFLLFKPPVNPLRTPFRFILADHDQVNWP
jgi:hypothetical protein